MPFLFTTRWAGTFGFIVPAPFIAHPTIRADNLVPRQFAMAPYDVTLPFGICRATSYTNSKKLSSFFPDGFNWLSLSVGLTGLTGLRLIGITKDK